jgi:hypothetical protein
VSYGISTTIKVVDLITSSSQRLSRPSYRISCKSAPRDNCPQHCAAAATRGRQLASSLTSPGVIRPHTIGVVCESVLDPFRGHGTTGSLLVMLVASPWASISTPSCDITWRRLIEQDGRL